MAEFLVESDPKLVSPDAYRDKFRGYLQQYEYQQLEELLLANISTSNTNNATKANSTNKEQNSDGTARDSSNGETKSESSNHYSIWIHCSDLIHYDAALAYTVIHHSKLLLPIFEESVMELQTLLMQNSLFHNYNNTQNSRSTASSANIPLTAIPREASVKRFVHVRLTGLPPISELTKQTIGDIRAYEVDSLVQLSGTIVRTGGARLLDLSKEYECQNPKCRYRFTVFTDPEQDNMIPQPRTCPRKLTSADSSSYNRTGNSSGVNSGGGRESGDVRKPTQCNSTNLREIEGSRVCVDFQEIKIQDHIERLPLGRVPRSIIVILHADLVDKFNAGEDVTIVGVVIRQWKPVSRGNRCAFDIAIEANSIVAVNSVDKIRYVPRSLSTEFEKFWSHYRSSKREIEGRNLIIKSVCPQLYGLYFVKLCLLLTIIGGTDTQYDGGVRRRSQSHLLIVGDPGCGKSQLLRFASQLSLRSVVTTGIGTTGAGLTCTAVRDGPDWSLEAGALVLANDGICCIDEFACIREQDRATVHEAMEQQTISIAKAGLVVKLNTRTTVVACCNPKGNYDVTADITTNTAIASPLLSRFDTIIILRDIPNKEWDKQVSTFLLKQAVGSIPTQSNAIASRNKGQVWHVDKLREYVAFVKNNLQPRIGPAARILLMRYYQIQRQSDDRSSARTTVRLLESLMRLSEAHAKLMFRGEVMTPDAIVAIACVSSSHSNSSLLEASDSVQEDFPVDDEESFELLKEKVFRLLHYSEDKLQKELVKEIVINTSNDNRNSIASIDSRSRPLSRVGEHKFRPEGIQGTAANVEFDTGDTSSDDQVIAIDIEKLEPHREQLDEVFMDKSHAFSTINGDFDVERSASFEVGAVDASEKFQRDKSISDSDTSSNSAKVKEDSGVAKLPTVLDNKMTSKFSSQNRMATLGRIMKNSDSNINSFKHVGSVSRSQLSSQIVRSGKVSSGDTAITHLPLDNVSTQQSCVDKSNRFVKKIQTNSYAAAPHDSLHVGMVGDENGNIVHTSDACIPKDNGNDFLESHDGGIVLLNGSDNGNGNGNGHGNGNINGSTTGNPSGGVAPTNIIASDSLKDKGIAASLKRKFRTLMKDNLIDDDW